MPEVCSQCGNSDFASDPESHQVCTHCGLRKDSVKIESRHSTSDFQPSSSHRDTVQACKRRIGAFHEGKELKTKRDIRKVVSGMGLPGQCEEIALRIYTLMQERGFLQGRKSARVVAVSLYIACRMQKSPFLLIDFADFLGLDLFQLGKYFLKSITVLKLLSRHIPLLDPLFYLQRYCSKLGFEECKLQVASTAMRIVKRMNRDWMCEGRRPTGLWGAAILIAARIHGFQRSTQQILTSVKVSSETIRKRLEEFQRLPVAALAMDEFEAKFDSAEWDVSDPPCYRLSPPLAIADERKKEPITQFDETLKDSCSDVDDDEVNDCILSPEESALKRVLWDSVNRDWLEKQHLRDEQKLKIPAKIPVKRRPKLPVEPADDPADALRKSGKLSKKMETYALEQLWK